MLDMQTKNNGGLQIGIDVGGTFTDFVAFNPRDDSLFFYKEPSTPDEPARALIEGLSGLLEALGLGPRDISVLMHGTTIGLNAIIQRTGARIGLVVTNGYRDILEIGRCRMPSSFDFHAEKETPLIPRSHVLEIGARFSAKGEPTEWPEQAQIERVGAALSALDVDAAALVLINGYANPELEAGLAESLSIAAGGLQITSAAAIWPEIREYERTLVACLNSYIQPLMVRYFDKLRTGLRAREVEAPIIVTASNGGSLSAGSALKRPVETILSGPASGVMAAVRLAQSTGMAHIITFDMGGTSSDIAIASAGAPELSTRTDVGGLPLVLPVVDVSAIGAGGGSIVWVDKHGILKVGPRSTGANPGPVSYGHGGTEPAVTDCYLTLGYIDPAAFLGGRMRLDAQAARDALSSIARRIGLDGEENLAARAAEGALAVTTAGMASALFKTLAQRGLDPRGFALVPFGGAGPTHATLLAEEVGIPHVIVPPAAGTFCAMGAAAADLRRDFVRTLRVPLNPPNVCTLVNVFDVLQTEGEAWLTAEGGTREGVSFERAVDMRYVGQAYELRVPLHDLTIDADTIVEAFHREHERIYGFRDPDASIELGTARLAATGKTPDLPVPTLRSSDVPATPKGTRNIFQDGVWVEATVYDRAALAASQSISGPAIVEQPDTTVVIRSGWSARVDHAGNLHLEGRVI
ncbi:hydantoinase/oxoprolinase family protein [Paraburkholderia sp.]|uniref:hydantoinase/oxoprolinase family protein n=1 Tax=Paraburkholderia sp. TaxID=1926495 RepID=UPI0039E63295